MALLDPNQPEFDRKMLEEVSIQFLKEIKRHYTRDTAVDVMDALSPILGKDWKGRVVFHLVNDTYQGITSFRIMRNPTVVPYEKIMAIKWVRSISGCGLTEAKHLVEAADFRQKTIILNRPPDINDFDWNQKVTDAMAEIRRCGFTVEV